MWQTVYQKIFKPLSVKVCKPSQIGYLFINTLYNIYIHNFERHIYIFVRCRKDHGCSNLLGAENLR